MSFIKYSLSFFAGIYIAQEYNIPNIKNEFNILLQKLNENSKSYKKNK